MLLNWQIGALAFQNARLTNDMMMWMAHVLTLKKKQKDNFN